MCLNKVLMYGMRSPWSGGAAGPLISPMTQCSHINIPPTYFAFESETVYSYMTFFTFSFCSVLVVSLSSRPRESSLIRRGRWVGSSVSSSSRHLLDCMDHGLCAMLHVTKFGRGDGSSAFSIICEMPDYPVWS